MSDLSTKLVGIPLKNPLVLASGIMGVSASSMKFVEENGAGAVTMKSVGPEERKGHKNPTVYSWGEGLTNAVGLSNPGIDNALDEMKEALKRLDVPLILSVFGGTTDEFAQMAAKVAPLNPPILEINLSCPNVQDSHGRMFALDPKKTEETVTAVKKEIGNIPLFAKLTPDSPDIVDVAKAAEAAGANGITAVNTVSGLIIDIDTRRPILTNKYGGISGKAIKPIAVRAVYNLYKAVQVPIIGTGGVTTGADALEFIMAGATAVGVGSAVYNRGVDVFSKITTEMSEWMEKHSVTSLDELRGAAHAV